MNLELQVDQRLYGGWKSARIVRGIETVSGAFDLTYSEKWANQNSPWPIVEESVCKVLIDGHPVITGYVDRRGIDISSDSYSLSVSGRDKTGDLVDCSALLSKWEFRSIDVLAFVSKLCAPFGINVSLQPGIIGLKTIPKLSVDVGDSSFDTISTVCKVAGLLPVSDGNGGLLLTRAGTTRAKTSLVEGENILSLSGEFDATGRFSRYVILGQRHGSDQVTGAAACRVKATVNDESVKRTSRVLIVRPEGNLSPEQAKTRGQWEAKVRAGKGESFTFTVVGWTQVDRLVWPINALVAVKAPSMGIQGDMLITQATHLLDDSNGMTTELLLRRPDAFLPEPVVRKSKSTHRWEELNGGVK